MKSGRLRSARTAVVLGAIVPVAWAIGLRLAGRSLSSSTPEDAVCAQPHAMLLMATLPLAWIASIVLNSTAAALAMRHNPLLAALGLANAMLGFPLLAGLTMYVQGGMW